MDSVGEDTPITGLTYTGREREGMINGYVTISYILQYA